MANLPSDLGNRKVGSMMFIGETCSLEDCAREDFLPFRCPDCSHSFCVSHFRPTAHHCSSHDAKKDDFFVPLCPLCHLPPKNWSRDQDPNIAMSEHLDSNLCPALDSSGKLKDDPMIQNKANSNRPVKRIKRENECQVGKCRKIMVVPIDCKECQGKFCVEHRGQKEHFCNERKEAARTGHGKKSSGFFLSNNGNNPNGTSATNPNPKSNNLSSIGSDVKSKFSKMNIASSSSPSSSTASRPQQSNLSPSTQSPAPKSKDNKPASKPFNFLDKSDKWVPKPLFGVSKA